MNHSLLISAAAYNERRWRQGRVYPLARLGWLQLAVPTSAQPASVVEAMCVADWQQARGLHVDGMLGPATCDALHVHGLRALGLDPAEQLTPNFGRDEFDCNDGTRVPDARMPAVRETARGLEVIRVEVCGGLPIIIVSGWRSEAHNRAAGGAPGSEHVPGRAADWRCPDLLLSLAEIRAEVDRLMHAGRIPMGGSQHYPEAKHRWLHTDHRGGKSPQHWDRAAGAA